MSSVYYPTQVVVLFKRIINAISTFSLTSSQYYLLKHAKAEDIQDAPSKWPRWSWDWPSISLSAVQMPSMTEDLYPQSPPSSPREPDTIHKLLTNPALYDPLRIPRNPIVLCHGTFLVVTQ